MFVQSRPGLMPHAAKSLGLLNRERERTEEGVGTKFEVARRINAR